MTARTETAQGATPPAPGRLSAAVAVIALALGCFAFVSTELMPIGILPALARGVHVSLGEAGFLVTGFAFVVALAATPLTVLTGRLNRKGLMLGLLALCALGNLGTCLAQDYAMLLASRVVIAAAIGIFWSTAAGFAIRLVDPRNAVRATSAVYGGLALAAVLGIPGGALLGAHAGWRAVFAGLAGLSLAVLVLMALVLPSTPAGRGRSSLAALPAALRHPSLLAAVGLTAVVMTGNFLGFTYVAPYLEQEAGIAPSAVGILLLVYGVAGLIANFAIGPLVARAFRPTMLATLLVLGGSLVVLLLGPGDETVVVAALIAWGASYTALPLMLQTWVFTAAAAFEGADAASSLYVVAYNAAIGTGALAGGLVIDRWGPAAVMLAAALAAGLAILIAAKVVPRG